jgi:beta-lactamase class A
VIARFEDLARGFEGVLGVAAKRLDTGEELAYNGDDVFPTASTFKTVLLYVLYQEADAGRIDLTQRLTLRPEHRVPGSGVLQDLDPGATLTIKDIATLMITVSDNMATDLIYDLLGRQRVAQAVRALGMEQTSLPLDTWEILAGLHDLDPADPSLTYDTLKARLASRLAPLDCRAAREAPDNNVTTPRDMVRLYEAIARGDGLSRPARDAVIDILKRQKFRERLPALLPFGVQVAHKTGSIRGVRNDAGLVYAGDLVYAVALFTKQARDGYAATQLLARASLAVYEQFVGPAGQVES